jgi:hypothetical protein
MPRALEPPPPEYYEVQKSARPVNALVPLPLGFGNDPATLQRAIKLLERKLDKAGVRGLIFGRESKLYSARTPSEVRRRQAHAAQGREEAQGR